MGRGSAQQNFKDQSEDIIYNSTPAEAENIRQSIHAIKSSIAQNLTSNNGQPVGTEHAQGCLDAIVGSIRNRGQSVASVHSGLR